MNIKLVQQKMQMQIAINWLEIIQVCEDNINRGFDITYYLEKKENAINLGIAVGTGKEIIFQGSIYKIIKYNR